MNITLRDVGKRFSTFHLQDINLEVESGAYTVVLGPSGSGKTLLLEMIAGLIPPDRGEIINPNRHIGLIYQDFMLFPHLTVYHNIAYGLKVRKQSGSEIDQRVGEVAGQLGIDHLTGRRIRGLSGGEKQRVAIARAMAIRPDLYLIDEPTASLDLSLKTRTREIFMDLYKKTGATFLHVTHDFKEALSLGDRIVILMDGRIVQDGSPDRVFADPVSRQVADFLGYRNVFRGSIREHQIQVSENLRIQVPARQAERAYIAIRSDEIVLSRRRTKSSARNHFPGTIHRISRGGMTCEIGVDIGIPLSVEITRQSLGEMGLKEEDRVWVSFKVSSIKVFGH